MRKAHAAVGEVLSAVAVGLFMVCQPVIAQNPNPHRNAWAQEQPAPQPGDRSPMSETQTFTGKIVKAGDKFVLSDPQGKMTYQLDDQQKAQEFVNQTVKVTGVLDPSTGMIRVSAIGPA